ncbi:ABC transporter permease [Halovulum dunhuangense]|nr:ABC transporter permease [Halovulum dunhuangense]
MNFVALLYHTVVREVREESGNATLGLLTAIGRVLILVALFYAMFELLGLRGAMIRGDVILFLVGGVLLFLMHNQAIGAVIKAGSATSPIMQHAPVTPTLMILSSALATLYLHILATVIILAALILFRGDLEIHSPRGILLPFFLAWASGVVIGLLFLAMKPFAPKLMQMLSTIYRRANMITSGKFFVANMLPNAILPFFDWNPLFHTIDQMRGALFVNYFPHKTSIEYPVYFVLVGLLVGMMAEFWLRRTVSRSTGAAR